MRRAAMRVDGSPAIGAGHVSRCLTLALALARRGWEVRFLAAPEARAHVEKFVAKRGSFVVITDEADVRSVDLLVIDHYAIAEGWERAQDATTILVVDDLADRSHTCDLLLDQNLWPDAEARYRSRVPEGCGLLLGPRFALLRPDLAAHRVAPRRVGDPVRRVVISMGGSDPGNQTERLAALVRQTAPALEIDLLVGGACQHADRLAARFSTDPQVRVHVDVPDVGALLAGADLAIGAPGVSLWERACLGVPSLCLAIAANQIEVGREAERRGVVRYLGEAERVSDAEVGGALESLLRDRRLREALAHTGQELVDGLGAARVVDAIEARLGAPFQLRRAAVDDARRYLDWANDPVVRANSLHPDPISWPDHLAWFTRKLADPQASLYVAELRGVPAAQVRFEQDGEHAVISLSIASHARGKRLASALLRMATQRFFTDRAPSPPPIEGIVQTGNQASRRAFLAAGFQEAAERLVHEVSCVSYWLYPPAQS